MKKIFLPILVLSVTLFTFSILPGYTEGYSYTEDAYDVLDADDEDDTDVDKETNFLAKKAKVKKKTTAGNVYAYSVQSIDNENKIVINKPQ